ncbi:MAG TPA: hypothetical protein VMZ53_14490 [Kofleriaceae bacterium]|nr:hypothetical protein [Kofleriaceae bacterium]
MRSLIFVAVFLASTTAIAGVPTRMPVQGYLTDTNGTVVDASVQIQFQIYATATGGTALYSENQAVTVDDGNLTVYLGSNVPLDMSLFRGGTAYLGITLQGEAEMSPRLELATVPFAAVAQYAEETASVPTGAVMMFDLDTCPAGWTALDAARGRAIVGVPAGGTRGGTVGTALSDVEDRAHSHSVGPFSTTTSSAGNHVHNVPLSFSTNQSTLDLTHVHTVDPPPHQHRWASYFIDPTSLNSVFHTYAANDGSTTGAITLQDWDNGMDSAGAGYYPVAAPAAAATGSTSFYYTQTTDMGSMTSSTANPPSTHAHQVSSNATAQLGGTHMHDVAIAASASGGATTGAVMPYLQLLICRKN